MLRLSVVAVILGCVGAFMTLFGLAVIGALVLPLGDIGAQGTPGDIHRAIEEARQWREVPFIVVGTWTISSAVGGFLSGVIREGWVTNAWLIGSVVGLVILALYLGEVPERRSWTSLASLATVVPAALLGAFVGRRTAA